MGLNTTLQSSGIPLFALRRGVMRGLPERQQHSPGAMTITEDPNAFTIFMDVPGFKSTDIEIEMQDQQLVITGNKQPRSGGKGETVLTTDFAGSFRRVLNLKTSISRDVVEADLDNGVLTVRLPRETKPASRKVAIRHPTHERNSSGE